MDHKSIAVHLTTSDCEGSSAVDGTDSMLWNDSDTNWLRYTESYMLCALSVGNKWQNIFS